jgi:hypothetical protein
MYRIGVRGRGTVHRPLLLPLLPVGFLLLLAAVALASSHVAFPFFPLLYVALLLALRLPWHAGAWRPSAAATTTVRQALPADGIDQEKELLGAMERRGEITAARAALETSLSVAAAEEMLSGLASAGHLRVGVQEGRLVYSLWD